MYDEQRSVAIIKFIRQSILLILLNRIWIEEILHFKYSFGIGDTQKQRKKEQKIRLSCRNERKQKTFENVWHIVFTLALRLLISMLLEMNVSVCTSVFMCCVCIVKGCVCMYCDMYSIYNIEVLLSQQKRNYLDPSNDLNIYSYDLKKLKKKEIDMISIG